MNRLGTDSSDGVPVCKCLQLHCKRRDPKSEMQADWEHARMMWPVWWQQLEGHKKSGASFRSGLILPDAPGDTRRSLFTVHWRAHTASSHPFLLHPGYQSTGLPELQEEHCLGAFSYTERWSEVDACTVVNYSSGQSPVTGMHLPKQQEAALYSICGVLEFETTLSSNDKSPSSALGGIFL